MAERPEESAILAALRANLHKANELNYDLRSRLQAAEARVAELEGEANVYRMTLIGACSTLTDAAELGTPGARQMRGIIRDLVNAALTPDTPTEET